MDSGEWLFGVIELSVFELCVVFNKGRVKREIMHSVSSDENVFEDELEDIDDELDVIEGVPEDVGDEFGEQ